jgi:hypothetical protein
MKNKMSIIFLLQCPKCKNKMKYHTNTSVVSDKRKACVYCGKSFKIIENIKERI